MENIVSRRIRERRRQLGWTSTKVATLAGITQSHVSRLENGKVGFTHETLVKVAGVLGLSVDSLYKTSSNVEDAPIDFKAIPVLSYVQAGRWTSVDTRPEGDIQEMISTNLDCPPSTFAMRLRGDSMEPKFSQGDIIVVSPLLQPQPGDFVVATDERGEATFKQYRSAGLNDMGQSVFELIPLNPIYGPLRSDRQQIGIVGVMIEHRTYRRR